MILSPSPNGLGHPPVLAHAPLRLRRTLPAPGEILVQVGSRVESDDVVARCQLPAPPLLYNLAEILEVPPHEVHRYLLVEEGERVEAGTVVARRGRWQPRQVRVGAAGRILSLDPLTGILMLQTDPETVELLAGMRGQVRSVEPGLGVEIESRGIFIQGALAFGPDQAGILQVLVTDPADPLTDELIDARRAFAILLGGGEVTAAALRKAIQHQVRGIIAGSIREEELLDFLGAGPELWTHLGRPDWTFPPHAPDGPELTLVLTEGIGPFPMRREVFDLLLGQDSQEVTLVARSSLRRPFERPRILVPQPEAEETSPPPSVLRVNRGAPVRLLGWEARGQIAVVRSLHPLRRLPAGSLGPALEVELEDGRRRWVHPLNVEVI